MDTWPHSCCRAISLYNKRSLNCYFCTKMNNIHPRNLFTGSWVFLKAHRGVSQQLFSCTQSGHLLHALVSIKGFPLDCEPRGPRTQADARILFKPKGNAENHFFLGYVETKAQAAVQRRGVRRPLLGKRQDLCSASLFPGSPLRYTIAQRVQAHPPCLTLTALHRQMGEGWKLVRKGLREEGAIGVCIEQGV